jgi:hypothetical protein
MGMRMKKRVQKEIAKKKEMEEPRTCEGLCAWPAPTGPRRRSTHPFPRSAAPHATTPVINQGTFSKHSGNIQGKFRENSGNIQRIFREQSREHSGNIQGTFTEHSGNIWWTFSEFSGWCRIKHSRNIQGTIREHSGNIQGIFREPSGNIDYDDYYDLIMGWSSFASQMWVNRSSFIIIIIIAINLLVKLHVQEAS